MRDRRKPKILFVCDYFLPGYKSGGGMRTLVNTVERLSDEYDFQVVTRDHDGKGDTTPYEGIKYGHWSELGGAEVRHLSAGEVRLGIIQTIVRERSPDLIYLNSFFSTLTLMVLFGRWRAPELFPPVVLAPCGELSDGAMRSKRFKKRLYCAGLNIFGLLHGVNWKASCEAEAAEVAAVAGKAAEVFIAPDLPPRRMPEAPQRSGQKRSGTAKFIYLSRISPKKNLDFAIESVGEFGPQATLDIYGEPDDDASYRISLEKSSRYGNASFRGPLAHHLVCETLAQFDYFILPTRGENFGHVILEALSAGCPVLLSDTTPWSAVQLEGAGYVMPLERARWRDAIRRCVEMQADEHEAMRTAAREFAETFLKDRTLEEATRRVFDSMLGRRGDQ